MQKSFASRLSVTALAVCGSFAAMAANAANIAPVISGTPVTQATVGKAYSFRPAASDANGDALTFSIRSKPSWATFNTATGALSGTPAAVGTYSSIQIRVSDGRVVTSLPRFNIQVASAPVNAAPMIGGAPRTSVDVGAIFTFRPTASDPEGQTLAFSIANKPAWMIFNTVTGRFSGQPTAAQVGTYTGITISTSDGVNTVSLPAFSLTVNPVQAQVTNGSATLSWMPPTQNTDGTALTNLSGYRIYYGTNPGALTTSVAVNTIGVASYVIDNLPPATYYFAITAVTASGIESDRSAVATKTL